MQYGKRQLIVLMAGLCACNAYAIDPGFYMGVMMGPAKNTGKITDVQIVPVPPQNEANNALPPLTTPVKPNTNQFGGRIFMGYKANQYFSVEGGFTYFSNIDYKTIESIPPGNETCGGTTVKVRDLDILGKASVTFRGFELFGKAGAALAFLSIPKGFDIGPNRNTCGGDAKSEMKVVPAFALGVGYDLSQNWVADISYNQVRVGSLVNNMDFYALGFTYHFVNTYCGQFLCD
jgi:hypothetical protein